MRELPIIFSTKMVQAIQDGHKTMTRRIAKAGRECKYKVGDKLYVRESFRARCGWTVLYCYEEDDYYIERVQEIEYKAGGRKSLFEPDDVFVRWEEWGKWKPSIHMPKKIARIWLEVTDTRREELQQIIFEDVIAEGIFYDDYEAEVHLNNYRGNSTLTAFANLWDKIHTKEENKFDNNPEVDVIEFIRSE